jgi:NAD(P)-dependent dehydrogenase (short-subunit alcohol dehydrogenase family)
MSLSKQRVVVIGGTSGIGFGVAKGAMADGASVVVGSSQQAKVDAIGSTLPGAEAMQIDVKDEASVAQFFERIGSFDHLVFTAGDWGNFGGGRIDANTDIRGAASQFDVRFWGALTVVKHAAPRISQAGSITLTNGMIAHKPRKGAAVGSAMAGAVEHLARALAVELAPVRVNLVCPGLIRTGIWDAIPEDQREERLQKMTRRLPIPRVGEPNETTEAYLYLMRGGYTTGQVLRVDGGASVT